MKEKIFKNFSLKILSALCAVVLWTIIVNIYDPIASVTVSNVNVQLINAESLTEKGYTYDVIDGSKIAVYISGPKSIITDIKSSDIVATADLSQITAFADYVDIDVKVVKDGRTITNIEVAPRTTVVKLDIENRVTKEFTVQPETTGTAATGYTVLEKSISPTSIRITGSTSSIDNIASVKAVYDVSGVNSDVKEMAPIVLYDKNGDVISDEKLQLGVSEVEFYAKVGAVKTVPLNLLGTSGKVAQGYVITGIDVSIDEVTIASADAALLERTNSINIPEDVVDVTNCNSDYTVTVKVSDFLERGLSLISIDSVEVTVKIEPVSTKKITIDKSKIEFTDLGEGLSIDVSKLQDVVITVSGDKTKLETITAGDITVKCSLKDLAAGIHSVRLQVGSKKECNIVGNYEISIEIADSVEDETH